MNDDNGTEAEPGSPSIVLVLVHGTFAAGAPWTHPESRFRSALMERLEHLHFDAFCWSGANNQQARLDAGAALSLHLQRLHERFPKAKHFVIAHSHGGNIALYAAKDANTRKLLAGIVTIATPFLQGRIRKVPKSIASVLCALFLAPFLMLISVLLGDEALRALYASPLGLAAFAFVGTARLPRLLYRRIRLWVARRQNEIVDALPWPVRDCRILNLQISLDEARFHLSFIGITANLFVLMMALLFWLFMVGGAVNGLPEMAEIGSVIGGVGCIGLVLSTVLALAMSLLLRANRFGFGDSAISNLFVDVRASVFPISSRTFLQQTDVSTSIPFHPHWGFLEYMLPKEYRHSRTLPELQTGGPEAQVTTLEIARVRRLTSWIPLLRHSRLYESADIGNTIAGWLLLETVSKKVQGVLD